jgi:predicted nucleic acid-binding protein
VQKVISEQDRPLPIWELQEAELCNALRLNVYWKKITFQQAESQIALYHERKKRGLYYFPEIQRADLMQIFQRLSHETPRFGCRTMDIFHVACAVQLGSEFFLTFDERQRALAKFAKLRVE